MSGAFRKQSSQTSLSFRLDRATTTSGRGEYAQFTSGSVTHPFRLLFTNCPESNASCLYHVSNDIAATLRSFTTRPTVHMAVVLAASPDIVEQEYRGMVVPGAEGDAGQVVISISRDPIEQEQVPMDRMTKDRFPGLHR